MLPALTLGSPRNPVLSIAFVTPLIASAVSFTFSAPLFVTVNQVNRVPVSFCIANVLLIALANVGVLLAYPQTGAGGVLGVAGH